MILYYITDRTQLGTKDEAAQRARLLEKIGEAARAGVDFIQLRERDMPIRELELLAREAAAVVGKACAGGERRAKLLINSRTDVALAAGADGVHLRSDDVAAGEARAIAARSRRRSVVGSRLSARVAGDELPSGDSRLSKGSNRPLKVNSREPRADRFFVAASCHTLAEIRMAEAQGADFAVFAPVFEKIREPAREGVGLGALRAACAGLAVPANVEGVGSGRMPVLALGGVTLANVRACLEAGAAGIAGIRLFQTGDVAETVAALREIG
jgi:thiamine-phosphate pyrophosphorylase